MYQLELKVKRKNLDTHEIGPIFKVCFETPRICIQLPPNWKSKNYIKFPMTKYTCTFVFLLFTILNLNLSFLNNMQNLKTKNLIKFIM
jgi:hypothetical protein